MLAIAFDIQAIDYWHDLVADGQELHCMLTPAQKQGHRRRWFNLPEIASAVVALKQSLLCVLYHELSASISVVAERGVWA